MTEATSLHKTFSTLLESRLKQFQDREPNLVVCTDCYTIIFNSLVEVIEESKAPISNEGMNYLAQQYYDAVLINNRYELDPNIFTQRAKVENIATKELALLVMMLKGTDFVYPLIEEIKRRS